MAVEYAVTDEPRMPPVHPGEILREDVFPALGLTIGEAAASWASLGRHFTEY